MSVWSFKIDIFSVHDNVCLKLIFSIQLTTRSIKESHCDIMIFSWLSFLVKYKFSLTSLFISRSGK